LQLIYQLKYRRTTHADGEARYKEANSTVQREARKDKSRWIEEKYAEVEEGLKLQHTRKAFAVIKSMRKGFQPRQRT